MTQDQVINGSVQMPELTKSRPDRLRWLSGALIALGAMTMFASLCFSIALAHIGMAVAVLGWLLGRVPLWRMPGFFLCMAFVVWVLLGSVLLHLHEGQRLIHSRYGTMFIWLAMYLVAIGLAQQRTRRWALYAALATMTASVVVSLAQFLIGFSERSPPFRIDADGLRYESSSGFLAKHLTQGFMMTLLGLVYLGQSSAYGVAAKWTWIGRGLATTAVLLANSRSGILGFAAAVGTQLVARRGLKPSMVLSALAILVSVVGWIWLITPHKIAAVLAMQDGRIIIWEAALVMVERRPWFGVGTKENYIETNEQIVKELYPDGSQDEWSRMPHAHNIYLGLATERGIPAFVLYALMVAAVLRHLYRRRVENPTGWQLGCGATAAMMVGGMTEHYAGLSLPSYGFFCVLGMAMALDRKYLEEIGVVEAEQGLAVIPDGDAPAK